MSLQSAKRTVLKRLFPTLNSGSAEMRWWNRSTRSEKRRAFNKRYWDAASVLSDAVLWLDVGRSTISGGKLVNLGTGGSALNATFGNTTGVDTFDPAYLPHSGTNYLYLPGLTGNYASAPDIAAYDNVGDLEVVCRLALDTWASGVAQSPIGSMLGDPNRRWRINLTTSGILALEWWPTGLAASSTSRATTSAVPFANASVVWIKVRLTVSTGDVVFQWAADQPTEPSSWTTLPSSPPVGATTLPNVAAPIEVGATFSGTANLAPGKFFRAIVRDGGTTVFDADFTRGITSGAQTTFTESSANAATVTINRATSGRKSVAVTRPTLLFGTDDYLEVADNALVNFSNTDSFTVVAVTRQWATPPNFSRTIAKYNPVTPGWAILNNATTAQRYLTIYDGTTTVNGGSSNPYTLGALNVTSGVRSVSLDNIVMYSGTTATAGTPDTTTGTLSNALPLRIGADASGQNADLEFVAAAVFRRALTASEIAAIVAYYGAA